MTNILLGLFIGLMIGFSIGMLYTALSHAKKWDDEDYKEQLREEYDKTHPTRHVADFYAIAATMRCASCGHEWKEHPFKQRQNSYCPGCGVLQTEEEACAK